MDYTVRRARTGDVKAIRRLIDANVTSGRLLDKPTVTLYEDIQEFLVAERDDGPVAGCGALHIMWEDLAEIRTIAVADGCQGHGVGRRLVAALVSAARDLGVQRVFVLTFEVAFFAAQGFEEIMATPVSAEVYAELLRSYDEGVAEFLDLDYVKPNTLGNTRMLLRLLPEAELQEAELAGWALAGHGAAGAGQQAGGDRGQERGGARWAAGTVTGPAGGAAEE
jgi:amino-acid N-acetyltransferase